MQLTKEYIEECRVLAKDIIQQRGNDYGDFKDIVNYESEFFYAQKDNQILKQVDSSPCVLSFVLHMIGTKLARLEHGYKHNVIHKDSVIDCFGYIYLLKQMCTCKKDTLMDFPKMHENNKFLVQELNKTLKDTYEAPC